MACKSLSKVGRFLEVHGEDDLWVGIDVHKRSYHVAVVSETGWRNDWSCGADPQVLAKQLEAVKEKIMAVAHEAGPTGFTLARCLQQAGIKVLVAAPSRIPRPVTRTAKTDKLDCRRLADYASKGMLRGIAVPTLEEDSLRCLCRRRDQLAKSIRKSRQRIKSLLLHFGIKEPAGLGNWSKAGIESLRDMDLPSGIRHTLDSHLLELDHLLALRTVQQQQLAELLAADERQQRTQVNLTSIPGIGFVTAAKFQTELFRPDRFNRAEEVVGLVGLAPVVRQSGEGEKPGRIPKAGKRELRSLLIEAAWRWQMRDSWARQHYKRILAKTGIAQKAIVALARKLCIIMWRLAVELRPYRNKTVG